MAVLFLVASLELFKLAYNGTGVSASGGSPCHRSFDKDIRFKREKEAG